MKIIIGEVGIVLFHKYKFGDLTLFHIWIGGRWDFEIHLFRMAKKPWEDG